MPDSSFPEKIPYNLELNRAVDLLLGNEFLPHTCQIFERNSDSKMRPFGSGVMALIGGSHYILTASHVAEHLWNSKDLYIRTADGYVSIIGSMGATHMNDSSRVDLAYIKLSPELLPDLEGGYKFLPLSKFRKHSKLFYAAQYCVFGYPIDSTKEVEGKLKSIAQGYILEPAKPNVYQHYNYDPELFFVLEFKGKGKNIRSGGDRKITNQPYGLSGCGLWLILPSSDGTELTVDYRLIGIMTEFQKGKYYCLVGNKIEILVDNISKFEGLNYTRKGFS